VAGGFPLGVKQHHFAASLYRDCFGYVEKTMNRIGSIDMKAGTSSRIENYLGFPSGISGDELAERALKQARHFGSEIAVTRWIEAVLVTDTGYRLELDGGEHILAPAVLLSTGVEWHRIEVPGLDRLLGRGILYGASRQEAHSLAGKRVFVVGGGNSAGQAAVFFLTMLLK
jgi:thioredoxin reductase (NADPH)